MDVHCNDIGLAVALAEDVRTEIHSQGTWKRIYHVTYTPFLIEMRLILNSTLSMNKNRKMPLQLTGFQYILTGSIQ